MNLGLMTQHCLRNFGSMLQADSLYRYLSESGQSVEIINYWPDGLYDFYHKMYPFYGCGLKNIPRRLLRHAMTLCNSPDVRKSIGNFMEFGAGWKFSKNLYMGDDALEKKPPVYDAYVAGSDAIWHPDFLTPARALRFAQKMGRPTIAYAPSIGVDDISSREARGRMKSLLSGIGYISCRERVGAEFLSGLLSRRVETVLDPVFLHSPEWWMRYVGARPMLDEKYVFAYVVHPNPNIRNLLRKIRAYYGMPVALLVSDLKSVYCLKHDMSFVDAGPKEFLNLLYYSNISVVSSFHGVAFSILFKKNFYHISFRGNDPRASDLCERLGVKGRLLGDEGGLSHVPADFSETDALLHRELGVSKGYLDGALLSAGVPNA